MALTTLLHPTDFSENARHALPLAVELARMYGASLHILHVAALHAEDPARTEVLQQQYELAARDLARGTSAQGEGRAPDIRVSSERRVSVFEGILEKVEELNADLVVMGTHGRSGIGKFLIGSEAEKVLRHVRCNVLTVRTDARLPRGFPRHILVPVDLSDDAMRALELGREFASRSAGHLTLLHVVEPIPAMYYAGGLTSRTELDPDLPMRVASRVSEWSGLPASDVRGAEGQPGLEIVRISSETGADLVVMGTRGRTGLEHVLVGSVTERVCRQARVPVLAVK